MCTIFLSCFWRNAFLSLIFFGGRFSGWCQGCYWSRKFQHLDLQFIACTQKWVWGQPKSKRRRTGIFVFTTDLKRSFAGQHAGPPTPIRTKCACATKSTKALEFAARSARNCQFRRPQIFWTRKTRLWSYRYENLLFFMLLSKVHSNFRSLELARPNKLKPNILCRLANMSAPLMLRHDIPHLSRAYLRLH